QKLFCCGGTINAEAKLLDLSGLREQPSPLFAVNSHCLAISPDGRSAAMDLWNDRPPYEVWVCDIADPHLVRRAVVPQIHRGGAPVGGDGEAMGIHRKERRRLFAQPGEVQELRLGVDRAAAAKELL